MRCGAFVSQAVRVVLLIAGLSGLAPFALGQAPQAAATSAAPGDRPLSQIGRASCRERV